MREMEAEEGQTTTTTTTRCSHCGSKVVESTKIVVKFVQGDLVVGDKTESDDALKQLIENVSKDVLSLRNAMLRKPTTGQSDHHDEEEKTNFARSYSLRMKVQPPSRLNGHILNSQTSIFIFQSKFSRIKGQNKAAKWVAL